MKKFKLIAHLILFVFILTGCAARKNIINFQEKEINIGRNQYWTEEASAVTIGDVGFKRKKLPRYFEPQENLSVDSDGIEIRSDVSQDIDTLSLLQANFGYDPKKIAEITGSGKRQVKEIEKFRITILGLKNEKEIIKKVNNNITLNKDLKVDANSRIITAVAVIFDHDSNQVLEKGGEVKAEITKIDGKPNFRFLIQDKENLKTKYANEMIVGYEMKQICWDKDNGQAKYLIKDLRKESEKDECPGNTTNSFGDK